MKIGIYASTLDKKGYGRFGEKTYVKLKEYGFSAVDFRMMDTNSLIYTLSQSESDALLKREKELAYKAGIEIFQVHGPWRCPPQDFTEEDRNERLEKMKLSIRAAAILGAKNWVIHPLMPFGITDIGGGHEKETRKINIEFLKRLLIIAKKYGVYICVENMPMPNFSLATPEQVLDIVKEINDEHLRICLDTGHANIFGLDVAEEIYKIKDKLQVLHIHDNVYKMDLHMLPYCGNIKWGSVGKALNDVCFKGVFSLETLPPTSLPNDLFERASKLLCDTAKFIVNKNKTE